MMPFTKRTSPSVYTLATEKQAEAFIEEGNKWCSQPNQHMFLNCKHAAISAVAEYLANLKGLTLYKCNAKYNTKEQK